MAKQQAHEPTQVHGGNVRPLPPTTRRYYMLGMLRPMIIILPGLLSVSLMLARHHDTPTRLIAVLCFCSLGAALAFRAWLLIKNR